MTNLMKNMNFYKKGVLLSTVILLSLLITSFSSGGSYVGNYQVLEMRFDDINNFGPSLGFDLSPNSSPIDVKEPNDFQFQNADGDMDIEKLMSDGYGFNNYIFDVAKYYYMHGRWGSFDCMDGDNFLGLINTEDPTNNSVTIIVDTNLGQIVWAQLMS